MLRLIVLGLAISIAIAGCGQRVDPGITRAQRANAIAISDSGDQVAVTGSGKAVIYRFTSGKPVATTYRVSEYSLLAPRFANFGRNLLAWSGRVYSTDLTSGKTSTTFDVHSFIGETPIAISPDGRLILCGQYVVDLAKSKKLAHFHTGVNAASSDFSNIIGRSEVNSKTVTLWKRSENEYKVAGTWEMPCDGSELRYGSVEGPGSTVLVVGAYDVYVFHGQSSEVRVLARADRALLSPSGELAATMGPNGIELFNTSTLERIGQTDLRGAFVGAISRNGSRLAVVDNHDQLHVYELPSLKLIAEIDCYLALSPSN